MKEKISTEQQQMIDAINAKIAELKKEDFAIDMERGKGITLERSEFIGDRQREIYKEINKLKGENS